MTPMRDPPREDDDTATVVMMVLALCIVGALMLGMCGCGPSTGTMIATSLEGAAATLDATERAEGNVAIDQAVQAGKGRAEAEAALDHVRSKWQPVWVALSTALAAAVAWSEGRGELATLVAAYCTLARQAPVLGLATVVLCAEVPKP